MRRAERKQWAAAQTLGEVGGLMARWLEGDLRERPAYYGPTDLDSPELARLCAGLCRAGFLTDNSQLAGQWTYRGETVRARAWVSGFADDTTLTGIRRACGGTDLVVLAHRTPLRRQWFARRGGDAVPVTASDRAVYTAAGDQIPRSCIADDWSVVGDGAHAELLAAWQVDLIDPQWCRNGLLWDVLAQRFLGWGRSGVAA